MCIVEGEIEVIMSNRHEGETFVERLDKKLNAKIVKGTIAYRSLYCHITIWWNKIVY